MPHTDGTPFGCSFSSRMLFNAALFFHQTWSPPACRMSAKVTSSRSLTRGRVYRRIHLIHGVVFLVLVLRYRGVIGRELIQLAIGSLFNLCAQQFEQGCTPESTLSVIALPCCCLNKDDSVMLSLIKVLLCAALGALRGALREIV